MSAQKKKLLLRDFFTGRDNVFLKGLQPTLGFSFQSEGVTSSEFEKQVRLQSHKTETHRNRWLHELTWVHSRSGIEAEVTYVQFPKSNALQISGRLFNRGRKTIKHIIGPIPLRFDMALPISEMPGMTTVYGGAHCCGDYPPRAYRVNETEGVRIFSGGQEYGQSTDGEMPYMIVTDQARRHGFFCALEWPAKWDFFILNFIEGRRRMIKTTVKVDHTNLTMKPGDSVRIPTIHIGFFKGDAVDGSNALRRHFVQNLRGLERPLEVPPVFFNHFFGMAPDWTIKDHLREANAYADLGVEYYVVDASWFAEGFREGIGNWEREDKVRFPDGMARLAEHVRSLGMKFGSWLEIEWAMKKSHWGRKHRDWFDDAPGRYNHRRDSGPYKDLLLRVADPRVRRQVVDFLETWVNKYGIEWLRWDNNNSPADFWDANEESGQSGKQQIEYAEGFYTLLDDFRRRCPQVHIEACSAGGHRMDMGTLRRADSAWMNDNTETYNPIRRFQSGLNRVLPGSYANSCVLWAGLERQFTQNKTSFRRNGYPPALLRSRMGGTFGFTEPSSSFSDIVKEQLRKEIKNYKAQRHLLLKDYYPLFTPQSLKDFDGWQFHDPDKGEGFFQVFRCDSLANQIEIKLRGLDQRRTYVMKDVDTGRKTEIKGGETLKVRIPKPEGVRWVQYRVE